MRSPARLFLHIFLILNISLFVLEYGKFKLSNSKFKIANFEYFVWNSLYDINFEGLLRVCTESLTKTVSVWAWNLGILSQNFDISNISSYRSKCLASGGSSKCLNLEEPEIALETEIRSALPGVTVQLGLSFKMFDKSRIYCDFWWNIHDKKLNSRHQG